MHFYISFILFNIVIMCVISKNIVTKSGLEFPKPNTIGLKFFAEFNNTGGEDYTVEVHPDECCLDSDDSRCNIVQIVGSATDIVPDGTTKILQLMAPLLDPYNRKGYCTVYVDYKTQSKPKHFVRDTLKIKFDTTLYISNLPDEAKLCRLKDENPLNDCKPVNCDIHYNGRRSFFHVKKKQCTDIPTCMSKKDSDVPKIAYNPTSNKCVSTPSISTDDINFIKALTGGKDRKTKDILIIKLLDKANATISDKLDKDLENIGYSTMISRIKGIATTTTPTNELILESTRKLPPQVLVPLPLHKTHSKIHDCIIKYCFTNKYTLMALSGIILLQCCMMCTMIYCLTRSCACAKKKKVVNKYFNYRQDASVTTPLICTSNIDTETTDYQYLSESSNYIDKKIKCYKACQKERKNNIKLSMSDDILSKCITRRDWHRLPRSETIPEVRNDDDVKAIDKKDTALEHKKNVDMKVNFQEECIEKKPRPVKSIVKKPENKVKAEILSDSSEKEIRCHSYNTYEGNSLSNMAAFKKSSHSKNFGMYKQEKKHTDSIEKGAQAYFSNDSIDDFLSERGVLFIGDNASKYSFTSISSAAKSSDSSQSSKTSKNNVVKNVISLLSRNAKGPSSDPGLKKSKGDLNLELLHISRASVCSSSNDTDLGKDLKRIKDSTSSL